LVISENCGSQTGQAVPPMTFKSHIRILIENINNEKIVLLKLRYHFKQK